MFELMQMAADYADVHALEYSLFRDETAPGVHCWYARYFQRDQDERHDVLDYRC